MAFFIYKHLVTPNIIHIFIIKQVADIEIVLGRSEENLHRRISEEVDKSESQMQNLYSVMDSRFDKFEARLLKDKQTLKG